LKVGKRYQRKVSVKREPFNRIRRTSEEKMVQKKIHVKKKRRGVVRGGWIKKNALSQTFGGCPQKKVKQRQKGQKAWVVQDVY